MSRLIDPREQHARRGQLPPRREWVTLHIPDDFAESVGLDKPIRKWDHDPIVSIVRRHEVVAAREAGATFQQIADRFGVSRQRIHQIWHRAA